MIITLHRFLSARSGTFGDIEVNGHRFFSVEKPWVGNTPFVSCIPAGRYAMALGKYHRGGYQAFELLGVPGRSDIKIHIGNTPNDVSGCIAIGGKLGFIDKELAVLNSRKVFEKFMMLMGGRNRAVINIHGGAALA